MLSFRGRKSISLKYSLKYKLQPIAPCSKGDCPVIKLVIAAVVVGGKTEVSVSSRCSKGRGKTSPNRSNRLFPNPSKIKKTMFFFVFNSVASSCFKAENCDEISKVCKSEEFKFRMLFSKFG